MPNPEESAIPPVKVGDEISFPDENGQVMKATVEGFHSGIPILSEPVPSESAEPPAGESPEQDQRPVS